MNKLDLIAALKNEAELTKSEAAAVVDMFFNEMANALAKGDRVEIRGLCSFFVKKYKAYAGRNPKTGEPTRVKPKKLPFFKCGMELKERVNL
jgi:integration host factor subunit beta